jgi:hypothetical protein
MFYPAKCYACGRVIHPRNYDSWAYRKHIKGSVRLFCCWKCLRGYEAEHPDRKYTKLDIGG